MAESFQSPSTYAGSSAVVQERNRVLRTRRHVRTREEHAAQPQAGDESVPKQAHGGLPDLVVGVARRRVRENTEIPLRGPCGRAESRVATTGGARRRYCAAAIAPPAPT